MRTVVYSGTLRALTSIAHNSRPTGNNHDFRREALILESGKRLTSVPVVSGSVIRGSLRRKAAALTHQALVGDGRLPFPVVHALTTGGSLRETRTSGEVLTGERQAILRDAIPMFGLFGLAAGGRIMSGRLQVDKALPVATETLYLGRHYGVDLDGYEPPSIRQVLQRETYTRNADVNDSAAQMMIADQEEARDIPKGSGNMIYSHETVSPGTRFFHSIVLSNGTPSEVSFFDDLIRIWGRGATMGGQVSKGHGRIATEYTRTVLDVFGEPTAEEARVDWREHMRERPEQIASVTTWL